MLDVIYPCHNRLYYTQITFPRVLHECIQTESKLWIYDDNSEDGTSQFIQLCLKRSGYPHVNYIRKKIGNSTFCINETLRNGKGDYLYKVDNDILIPLGSFEFMKKNLPRDGGFMMMRESGDYPKIVSKEIKKKTHIGGVGIFRRSAFGGQFIKTDKRFFGFTAFQTRSNWGKYIIDADNMNLDMSPYYARAKEYQQKGWGRDLCKVKSIFQ